MSRNHLESTVKTDGHKHQSLFLPMVCSTGEICEHSNCNAPGIADFTYEETTFKFCQHHANKVEQACLAQIEEHANNATSTEELIPA